MTAPRQILPGVSYIVTRRCTQRQFLLRPSKKVNEVFLYLLAVAASRYGIQLHAYCVMSNHSHIVLTDVRGRLPAFEQYLNALMARAVNAAHGRCEGFWGSDTYSAVRLVSPSDVIDRAAYTLANPTLAGLVRTGRVWPGAWSAPESIGAGPATIARPAHFFAENGSMPATAELELVAPSGFTSATDFRQQLVAALEEREREAGRRMKREFVGVLGVLRQKPTARPRSREPLRALNPRVASRDPWKRIEALARLKRFVDDYREALAKRRAGDPDVVFPAGTYLLRVAHGVRCAAPG